MAELRPLSAGEQAHVFATRGEPAPPPRLPSTIDPVWLGPVGAGVAVVAAVVVGLAVGAAIGGPVTGLCLAALAGGVLTVVLWVAEGLPVGPVALVPAGAAAGFGAVGLLVRLVGGEVGALAAAVVVGIPVGALVGAATRRALAVGSRLAEAGAARARRSPAARRAVVVARARIDWFSPEVDGVAGPSLVGSPGRARAAVPGGVGAGSVTVAVAGGGRTLAATAATPVAAGALVRVVAVPAPDTVTVEPA